MLSITAEYALRIMVVLAESEEVPTTSERIAELTKVPPDYAVKVLQMLARSKLVRAQRGRGGGFRLACDPAVVTMLDVVHAIDPLEAPKRPSRQMSSDGRGDLGRVYERLDDLFNQLREGLLHTTLADVASTTDKASRPTTHV